jgi:hypothetical protein
MACLFLVFWGASILFSIVVVLRQEEKNKRNINRKERCQSIPICRWHDLIPKRPEKLHQKACRHHKHLQQSSRIQNQFTKTLYTRNEQIEKECRKTIPFTIDSKNIKYLGINLTKEVKDLYNENYEPLKKEIIDYRRWKYPLHSWIGRINFGEHGYITKNSLHVQYNPHQNSNDISHKD